MNFQILRDKLGALRNFAVITTHGKNYLDEEIGIDIFRRYKSIRDQLIQQFPDLFGDLPTIREVKLYETSTQLDKGKISAIRLKELVPEMDYCIRLLSTVRLSDIEKTVKVTNEGIFFSGQYYDAFRSAQRLIKTAKKRISIVDNYLSENILDMIADKPKNVNVDIMTRKVSPGLEAAAKAFNKQYGNLSIRKSGAFHDRFLIIDEQEYYHFGASIKDLGSRGTMFSRIEEPEVVKELENRFAKEWGAADVVI